MLSMLVLLVCLSLHAQQNLSGTTPAPASQDTQAINVVHQALAVAGGDTAISAIRDYNATGAITYHLAQDVQGNVTIRGKGLEQFRIDANLPMGMRSQVMDGKITIKMEDGRLWEPHSKVPMSPARLALPCVLLAAALRAPPAINSTGYSLAYKGVVQNNGHSLHDIEIDFVVPGADPNVVLHLYFSVDFFIDTSTLQVAFTQEPLPGLNVRTVRYADYRAVNGIQVPFAITEEDGGFLQGWSVQLDSISFNAELQDSDFQF